MRIYRVSLISVLVLGFFACRPRPENSQAQDTTVFGPNREVDLSTYTIPDEAFSTEIWEQMANELAMHPQDIYDQYVKPAIASAPTALRNSIDKTEAVALYYYTANYYEFFNKALRRSHPTPSMNKTELKKWENIILAVASAINKQAGGACKVKRGTSLRPEVLAAIEVGGKYVDRGFMSTTEGEIPPEFQKGVTFKIEASRCRRIDWISRFPDEKEVLMAPGTAFKVVRKKASADGSKYVIDLKELPATAEAVDTVPLAGPDPKAGTNGTDISKVYEIYPKTFVLQVGATGTDVSRSLKLMGSFSGLGDGSRKAEYQNSSGTHNGIWQMAGKRLVKLQYQAGNRTMNLWFYVIDGKTLGRVTKASLLDGDISAQDLEDGVVDPEDLSQAVDELDITQHYTVGP